MTGSYRRAADRRRTRLRTELRPPAGRASFWCAVLLVLGVVSSVAIGYIRFNSEQVRMGLTLHRLRQEFALHSKELENLRVEVESYKSATYIHNAVDELKLGLREPAPGQVQRIRNGHLIRSPEWLQDRGNMLASK